MTFLYQNLLPQLLEKAKDTGYPVLIGLEEGFTASTEGDGNYYLRSDACSAVTHRFFSEDNLPVSDYSAGARKPRV